MLAYHLIALSLIAPTADGNQVAAHDVLGRFVGVWQLSTTQKPAKWSPEGREFTGKKALCGGD